MRRLIRVSEYIYRGCDIDSLFVADEAAWAKITKWCEAGNEVYFGEIAGKHSDVSVAFDLDDFKVMSEDQGFIDQFEKIVGNFGVSILDRMCERCSECGEEIYDMEIDLCDKCREELENE